ncbi:MAG TPA: histidine kinase, partial [Thermoanaerobaculia bacterium]
MSDIQSGYLLRWTPAVRGIWRRNEVLRGIRRLWRLFVGTGMRRPAPVFLWLRVGGVLLWGAVGCHTLFSQQGPVVAFLEQYRELWLASLAVFGLAFWENTREEERRRLPALALIGLQSAIALGTLFGSRSPMTSFLLVVIAGQLAVLETKGVRGIFLALHTLGAALAIQPVYGSPRTIFLIGFFLAVQVFVDGLCQDVLAGVRARRELLRAHAELRETRDLLAQSSQLAERLRISRELHDLLGHRLTALNLNLEVLSHLTEGRALHHATRAQMLAKLLLGDVRAAVSAMRAEPGLNLDASLSALVQEIPHPRIHLDAPAGLGLEDPDRAHALLRCVQEIVTNAVRHSGADNLWIEVLRSGNEVKVQARDDGRGVASLQPGNGLTGLSRRLADLGGTLELASTAGEGFQATVCIPVSGGVS